MEVAMAAAPFAGGIAPQNRGARLYRFAAKRAWNRPIAALADTFDACYPDSARLCYKRWRRETRCSARRHIRPSGRVSRRNSRENRRDRRAAGPERFAGRIQRLARPRGGGARRRFAILSGMLAAPGAAAL